MKPVKYKMAFTTGGLFRHESVEIAMLYLQLHDWKSVRERVVSENLLQMRTLSTSQRIAREICARLKTLSDHELNFLVKGSIQEQGYLLWIAICRLYQFIADFAVEVVREKFISLNYELHHDDFDFFYNKKSEGHDELEQISSTTRRKLRQVLFRMLREADILTKNNMIQGALLTTQLIDEMKRTNKMEIHFFPILGSEAGVSS